MLKNYREVENQSLPAGLTVAAAIVHNRPASVWNMATPHILFRNLCSSTEKFAAGRKKARNEAETVGGERNQMKSFYIGYLFKHPQK